MKKLIIIMLLFACLAGTAQAITYGQDFYSKNVRTTFSKTSNDPLFQFIGEVEGMFEGTSSSTITNLLFAQETGDPTATEGRLYYNATSEVFRYRKSGSWANLAAESGTVSLDVAYNNGNAIDVDGSAVALTTSDTDNNAVLTVDQNDATNDPDAITVTMGAGSTGTAVEIDSQTSGTDIAGDNWSVNQAGGITAVAGTFSGDFTFDGAGADIIFTAATDTIEVEDDAVLTFGDAGDVSVTWNATNLLIEAATDNTGQIIFGSTNAMDIVVNNDAADSTILVDISGEQIILNGWDLEVQDGDFITYGDSLDFTMTATNKVFTWQGLQTDESEAINIGADQDGIDLKVFGATTGSFFLWDASGDEVLMDKASLALGDGDAILLGDTLGTGDFSISDASDVLLIQNVVDGTGTAAFGASNLGIDVAFYGDAGGASMLWDENANTNGALIFNVCDIEMGDGDFIQLGDGADLTISATTTTTTATIAAGSVLTIADTDDVASLLTFGVSGGTHGLDVLFQGATAGDIVDWDAGADTWNFGVDATGVDVFFYGDTTLHWMLWDETNNLLSLDGATNMLEFRGAASDAHETTIAVVEPTKSNIVTLPDDTGSLSYIAEGGTVNFADAGTIPLTDAVVLWSSSGTDAATLPDGTSAGQILSIVLVAQGGGAATLTPASVTGSGWATMIFTNIGESATFLYVDSTIGWLCLGTFGASTQPLITQ